MLTKQCWENQFSTRISEVYISISEGLRRTYFIHEAGPVLLYCPRSTQPGHPSV